MSNLNLAISIINFFLYFIWNALTLTIKQIDIEMVFSWMPPFFYHQNLIMKIIV